MHTRTLCTSFVFPWLPLATLAHDPFILAHETTIYTLYTTWGSWSTLITLFLCSEAGETGWKQGDEFDD